MALFSIRGITIKGIACAVPANCEYNNHLSILNEKERDNFIQKAGIERRRRALPGICASDLCVAASKRILEVANIFPEEIGILVFVTQTPDYILPGNSMLIQKKLGLSSNAILYDVHQGCAGYVYGLSMIAGIMSAANIKHGLLLVGDTLTSFLSPFDRTTVPIFSDGGSATLMELSGEDNPMYFNLGADSNGFEAIHIKDGGARNPFQYESLDIKEDASGIKRADVHLKMEGVDVLSYSLKNVEPNIRELMRYSQCDIEEVDYFIFHQANRILNEGIMKKMNLPREKVPETLSVFGNTSSATIPLTICYRLGKILAEQRRKILLSGFGAGFSWGSALMDTQLILCPDLLEL